MQCEANFYSERELASYNIYDISDEETEVNDDAII